MYYLMGAIHDIHGALDYEGVAIYQQNHWYDDTLNFVRFIKPLDEMDEICGGFLTEISLSQIKKNKYDVIINKGDDVEELVGLALLELL